jgi:predicted RND superfamily exporter protein
MESEKVKEIKKVLECCCILTNRDLPMETRNNACHNCPYDDIERCSPLLVKNSLTYVNELERENQRLGNESNEMFGKYGKELQTATILIEKRNNEIIELKDRIAELEKEIKGNVFYAKGYAQGIKHTYEVVMPNKLKQFAERVIEKLKSNVNADNVDYFVDCKKMLGETLKELQGE